jgi:hypothetical protein
MAQRGIDGQQPVFLTIANICHEAVLPLVGP